MDRLTRKYSVSLKTSNTRVIGHWLNIRLFEANLKKILLEKEKPEAKRVEDEGEMEKLAGYYKEDKAGRVHVLSAGNHKEGGASREKVEPIHTEADRGKLAGDMEVAKSSSKSAGDHLDSERPTSTTFEQQGIPNTEEFRGYDPTASKQQTEQKSVEDEARSMMQSQATLQLTGPNTKQGSVMSRSVTTRMSMSDRKSPELSLDGDAVRYQSKEDKEFQGHEKNGTHEKVPSRRQRNLYVEDTDSNQQGARRHESTNKENHANEKSLLRESLTVKIHGSTASLPSPDENYFDAPEAPIQVEVKPKTPVHRERTTQKPAVQRTVSAEEVQQIDRNAGYQAQRSYDGAQDWMSTANKNQGDDMHQVPHMMHQGSQGGREGKKEYTDTKQLRDVHQRDQTSVQVPELREHQGSDHLRGAHRHTYESVCDEALEAQGEASADPDKARRDSTKASDVDQGATKKLILRRRPHSYEDVDVPNQNQDVARPATKEHDDEDDYEEMAGWQRDHQLSHDDQVQRKAEFPKPDENASQGARERSSSMPKAGHSELKHVQSDFYNQQINETPIMCAYLKRREDIPKPIESKYNVNVVIGEGIRISGENQQKLMTAVQRLQEALDEVRKEYEVQKSDQVPRKMIPDVNTFISSHSVDVACVFDQETQRVICMGPEADKAIAKVNLVMHEGVLHEEVVQLDMDVMKYIAHFNLLPIESGIKTNMQMDDGMEVAKITFKSENKARVQALKEQIIQTTENISSDMLKEVALAHNPSKKFRSRLENQFPNVFIDCHEECIELTGPKASVYRAKKEIEARFKEGAVDAPSSPPPEVDIKRLSQSVGASVTSTTPMSFRSLNGKLHVHALVHDITRMQVDIIVNAANEKLGHGGGVALAIAKAAGKELQDDCKNFTKGSKIKVTNHYLSKPGHLMCKHVMHAVGPIWDKKGDQKKNEKVCDQLRETFKKCLETADSMTCRSIAIPPISAGK